VHTHGTGEHLHQPTDQVVLPDGGQIECTGLRERMPQYRNSQQRQSCRLDPSHDQGSQLSKSNQHLPADPPKELPKPTFLRRQRKQVEKNKEQLKNNSLKYFSFTSHKRV
jgi:hypothetical protein